MSAVFTSTDAKVLMPKTILDGMIKETRTTSVIARLSGRTPMRFGEAEVVVFNDLPKAEFVEEGGEKSSTKGGFSSVTVKPHKAQVTMRFSEEVQWADEDHQLGVLQELSDAGAEALSRALDFGIIHRISPLTGNTVSGWEDYITASTLKVEIDSADADDDLRAAVRLLTNGGKSIMPTGMALDPIFSSALADLKKKDGSGTTSDLRYPQLGFGLEFDAFMNLPAAIGSTVSGLPEATDTKLRAIVGDFKNGLRWGIQRQLPVEIIRFGDPDGNGDLKRKNQIALRLETVFAWTVLKNRFALIEDKS